METGASLVLETIDQLATGKVKAKSQDAFADPDTPLKKAPKIFKEDCRISWIVRART
jgi:methionyl-tRNA formyltransferase